MSRLSANLLLLLTAALWGMGFVAQSTAMASIGPLLFLGLAFTLATLELLPFALIEARRAPAVLSRAHLFAFAAIGVLLFGGMASQQFGLLSTSVTNSGFLTSTYVVMVPLLAVAIYRQRPHLLVWLGAVLTFMGIFLLSGGRLAGLTQGDWLTLLCAMFWALQVLFIGRYASASGRPAALAATQFAVCAILALTGALWLEPFDMTAVMSAAPNLLYSGLISGGLAFTLQVIGQRHTTASQAAIFLSTESMFAALFGALILGERLAPSGIAGCAMIVAAILIVELGPQLAHRPRASAAQP